MQILPSWYRKYHTWKYHELLHWIIAIISIFIMIRSFANILVSATTSSISTVITQKILPGNLGISIPPYITFTPIQSNINTFQISTAILKNITIYDLRKTEGTDWTITVSATDFVAINKPVKQTGTNDTVSSGGTYNDSRGGTYKLLITKGGKAGVAKFAVSGLETINDLTTGDDVTIGTRGVTAFFAPAIYKLGDSWAIRVDTIPVSNLTVIPQTAASSESLANVNLGNKHTFSGKNDTTLLAKASQGEKVSNFSTDLLLSLKIPPFTYANKYTATLTITSN